MEEGAGGCVRRNYFVNVNKDKIAKGVDVKEVYNELQTILAGIEKNYYQSVTSKKFKKIINPSEYNIYEQIFNHPKIKLTEQKGENEIFNVQEKEWDYFETVIQIRTIKVMVECLRILSDHNEYIEAKIIEICPSQQSGTDIRLVNKKKEVIGVEVFGGADARGNNKFNRDMKSLFKKKEILVKMFACRKDAWTKNQQTEKEPKYDPKNYDYKDIIEDEHSNYIVFKVTKKNKKKVKKL